MMPLSPSITVHEAAHSEWSEQVARFRDYNYQQSIAYCELLSARRRAMMTYVIIRDGGTTIGLAAVRLHQLPVIGGGIAYIAGGPLVRTSCSHTCNRTHDVMAALVHEFVERRGYTLRILGNAGVAEEITDMTNACQMAGMEPIAHSRAYRTMLVDLDRPLDKVRASFSKYWRRNLRRSERAGLTLHVGHTPDLMRMVCELYDRLRERKSFRSALAAHFYSDVLTHLPATDRFTCIVARQNETPLGAMLISTLGDTCVPLIMASTRDGLTQYVAYALQWRSMEIAHARGQTRYDLGGIDPHENAGGYDFKRGMRGVECIAPGPFERRTVGFRSLVTAGSELLLRRSHYCVDNRHSHATAA